MEETKNTNRNGENLNQAQTTPSSDLTDANQQAAISDAQSNKASEEITPEKIESEANQIVEKIVTLMGIKVQARSKLLEDGTYYVNLRTRRSDGLLIGRRGSTILAIQSVANQIMKHRYPNKPIEVFVDVSGYRKKHETFLKKKALAVAKIVADTKKDMALDLLTDKELRMVEAELAPLGTVRVHAIGTGARKTVIISPITNES
ncbi:MAG: hypothetical protein ABIK31_03435 [candidate division WOR-3 bacterium]